MKKCIKTSVISDHTTDLYRVWSSWRTVEPSGKLMSEQFADDRRDMKEFPTMKQAIQYAVEIKMTDKDL